GKLLGVDVLVATVSIVLPGNGPLRRNDRPGLVARPNADRHAVEHPLRTSRHAQLLGIDVHVAGAGIGPGEGETIDRSALDDLRHDLVPGGCTHRDTLSEPLREARRVQPLRIDVAVAVATVLPGDDGTPAPVRDERRTVLETHCGGHRHATDDPLGNTCAAVE